MLVLTRKRNEMIQIGDDIVIKVTLIDKGTVRLGIQAPQDVRILRAELAPEQSAQILRSKSGSSRVGLEMQSVV